MSAREPSLTGDDRVRLEAEVATLRVLDGPGVLIARRVQTLVSR